MADPMNEEDEAREALRAMLVKAKAKERAEAIESLRQAIRLLAQAGVVSVTDFRQILNEVWHEEALQGWVVLRDDDDDERDYDDDF